MTLIDCASSFVLRKKDNSRLLSLASVASDSEGSSGFTFVLMLSLCRCVVVSLCRCVVVSLCRCVVVSLYLGVAITLSKAYAIEANESIEINEINVASLSTSQNHHKPHLALR